MKLSLILLDRPINVSTLSSAEFCFIGSCSAVRSKSSEINTIGTRA